MSSIRHRVYTWSSLDFRLHFTNVAVATFVLIAGIYLVNKSAVGQAVDQAKTDTVTKNRKADDSKADMKIADLPIGITSFGGALLENQLFVYGGHTGRAHEYDSDGQNKTLYRLDLKEPDAWDIVGGGPGLQGLALVAHGNRIYRIGGFNAKNAEGDDHDLHSVADFAYFDFDKRKWIAMQSMPVARSSFDAVVVGDVVYVAGGWTLNGKDGQTVWCDTAISLDLSKGNAKWESLPAPPFKRRALSVGYQDDKLYVIGGMQEKGGISTGVYVYDIAEKKWREGPSLTSEKDKAGGMEGFGSSAFNVGGKLVVSTYGGNVYTLSPKGDAWKLIKKLDQGRFFHRLLPVSQSQCVLVGGASMESGKFLNVEVLALPK